MSKSIYSLVLNDQLVSVIDKMAHKKGVSRSTLINDILAEFLSFTTPEKRFEDIFKGMESLVEQMQSFKFVSQPSPNLGAIVSAINFRYNPTVKYTIELFAKEGDVQVVLKVTLRSTNSLLILELNNFYRLWTAIENKYFSCDDFSIEGGRYIRKFYLSGKSLPTNQEISNAITEYIATFDLLLNLYFGNLGGGEGLLKLLEQEYINNLKQNMLL